jgi:hypothetical protein
VNVVALVLEEGEGCEEDREGGVLDSHRDLGARLLEPKQYERDGLANSMFADFCSFVSPNSLLCLQCLDMFGFD